MLESSECRTSPYPATANRSRVGLGDSRSRQRHPNKRSIHKGCCPVRVSRRGSPPEERKRAVSGPLPESAGTGCCAGHDQRQRATEGGRTVLPRWHSMDGGRMPSAQVAAHAVCTFSTGVGTHGLVAAPQFHVLLRRNVVQGLINSDLRHKNSPFFAARADTIVS